MKEKLSLIKQKAGADILNSANNKELFDTKVKYFGKSNIGSRYKPTNREFIEFAKKDLKNYLLKLLKVKDKVIYITKVKPFGKKAMEARVFHIDLLPLLCYHAPKAVMI